MLQPRRKRHTNREWEHYYRATAFAQTHCYSLLFHMKTFYLVARENRKRATAKKRVHGEKSFMKKVENVYTCIGWNRQSWAYGERESKQRKEEQTISRSKIYRYTNRNLLIETANICTDIGTLKGRRYFNMYFHYASDFNLHIFRNNWFFSFIYLLWPFSPIFTVKRRKKKALSNTATIQMVWTTETKPNEQKEHN